MNQKQKTIDVYNATAEKMAVKFRNLGARVEDIERGFVFAQKENPVVVEIGCGDGRDAGEIVKRTTAYTGLDISEGMIRIARRTVPETKFEVCDVEEYAFEQGIDLVFAFASLLHVDSEGIKKVLSLIHGSLSDKGVVYLSLKYGEGEVVKTDEFGTRTFHFYTPEAIKRLAGDGYEVLWEDRQVFNGQEWFTIVMKKNSP